MWLLPFALYEPMKGTWNHIGMVPTTAILSIFLFGIEELATQLEEPFTILPMQSFCDKIYNWCNEIVSWSPGDNGRNMRPVQTQHAYFTDGSANGYANNNEYRAPAPQEQQPAYSEPAPASNGQMSFEEFLSSGGGR